MRVSNTFFFQRLQVLRLVRNITLLCLGWHALLVLNSLVRARAIRKGVVNAIIKFRIQKLRVFLRLTSHDTTCFLEYCCDLLWNGEGSVFGFRAFWMRSRLVEPVPSTLCDLQPALYCLFSNTGNILIHFFFVFTALLKVSNKPALRKACWELAIFIDQFLRTSKMPKRLCSRS